MRVLNDDLFSVNTATIGTTESLVVNLAHMAGFSAQFLLTQTAGVLAGSLTAYGSNDGVTWSAVPSPKTISGTLNYLDNVADVYYLYLKYTLVLSGGTCSVLAKINAKGF